MEGEILSLSLIGLGMVTCPLLVTVVRYVMVRILYIFPYFLSISITLVQTPGEGKGWWGYNKNQDDF